jgi:hypothetical protein
MTSRADAGPAYVLGPNRPRTPPDGKVPSRMKLFLPQHTLEEWAAADKADVHDHALLLARDPTRYPVEPAVHVTALVTGVDEHTLLRKVRTDAQLQAIGAERLADSVVAGESAYDVVSGYVVQVPDAAAMPQPAETDLLAEFLLNKL